MEIEEARKVVKEAERIIEDILNDLQETTGLDIKTVYINKILFDSQENTQRNIDSVDLPIGFPIHADIQGELE